MKTFSVIERDLVPDGGAVQQSVLRYSIKLLTRIILRKILLELMFLEKGFKLSFCIQGIISSRATDVALFIFLLKFSHKRLWAVV